jgi:hypothetical protein
MLGELYSEYREAIEELRKIALDLSENGTRLFNAQKSICERLRRQIVAIENR